MRLNLLLIAFCLTIASCWGKRQYIDDYDSMKKVWGSKPVYASDSLAKKISYTAGGQAVKTAGNIYAYQQYIFQIDYGYGIHVILNSAPDSAKRVGFIKVLGCSQIAIRNNAIYTNSYDDLVVLGFSGNNITEISRMKNMFPTMLYDSPLFVPQEPGFYECPEIGKLVTGWTRDSILPRCQK